MTSSKKSQIIAGIALSTIFAFLLLMAHSGHQMDEAEKVAPGAIRSVSAAPAPEAKGNRPVKLNSFQLRAVTIQLLQNELDDSKLGRCERGFSRFPQVKTVSGYGTFNERMLDLRIQLASLRTARYPSPDEAEAAVIGFEHQIHLLENWLIEDPQASMVVEACRQLTNN